MMNRLGMIALAMLAVPGMACAQMSQRTTVRGNTEINATTQDMTAVATGQNTVAKNRVGVIKGEQKGDIRISVSAQDITTVAGGRNKKACTNIGGVVSNECK